MLFGRFTVEPVNLTQKCTWAFGGLLSSILWLPVPISAHVWSCRLGQRWKKFFLIKIQSSPACLLKALFLSYPRMTGSLGPYHCSVAKLCPTLCDPMDCSTPGSPVLYHLLEFVQTHVHWVSDALQLPHPLSPLCPPALNLSQHHKILLKREIASSFASFVKDLLRKVPGNPMWWAHLDILLTPKSAGRWNPVGKVGLRAPDVNQLFQDHLTFSAWPNYYIQ